MLTANPAHLARGSAGPIGVCVNPSGPGGIAPRKRAATGRSRSGGDARRVRLPGGTISPRSGVILFVSFAVARALVSRKFRRFQTELRWRILVVSAVVPLLLAPIEYRGGADRAHAHAFFQFAADVERGSLTHHHEAPADRHPGSAFFAPEITPGPAVALEPAGDQSDVLTASPARSPRERGQAIGDITVIALFVIVMSRGSPVWPAVRTLAAVARAPAAAPPRLAPR